MKQKTANLLKLLLGIAILSLLVYSLGLNHLYDAFLGLNPLCLPAIICAIVLSLLAGGLSLKILTIPLNRAVPFLRLTKYYVYGWTLRSFLPANIGEFSIIYFLSREDLSAGSSAAVFLIEKIMTSLIGVTLCILSLYIFVSGPAALKVFLYAAAGTIFLIFLLVALRNERFLKKLLGRYDAHLKECLATALLYLKSRKFILVLCFLSGLLKWASSALRIYLAFIAFGLRASFADVLLISTAVSIVALIPLSPNGLGIREATAAFLFQKILLSPEKVTGAYLVLLALTYAGNLLSLPFLAREKWDIKSFLSA